MGYWPLRNWWLLMMIAVFMFWSTEGGCIEEERRALLEIKFSLLNSYDSKQQDPLPTWIDHGSDSKCCEWERIKCNTTTGHIIELSLFNVSVISVDRIKWPLNVSLFLHFEELTSLNLSSNYLDGGFLKTEVEKLSSLKKLEILGLSLIYDIDNSILPILGALTFLRILDLSHNTLSGYFPINGKFYSEFAALENLEVLDLTYCNLYGTFDIQGFERVPILGKLEVLNLAYNSFNDSIITSLNVFPSLKALDLHGNSLSQSFPAQELAHLTNLERLDLGDTRLNGTPSIQDCKSLSRLKRLKSINLSFNKFDKSIISCLGALPSLKILDLSSSLPWRNSFPFQEFLNLPDLEVLLLKSNGFVGTLPMAVFTSFHHLEVLDLGYNFFVGSIPSAIQALSSLKAVSFRYNNFNGSLSDHGLCELRNLQELDLSGNMIDGTLPQCLKNLSSLKLLDISSNRFNGKFVPSVIANLTSLEYIDFSHNRFEGSFPFSSFSNHTKLEAVRCISENDKFEVETEEPKGWIPKFQLKVLVLSNCNLNRNKGGVIPGFLLHQHNLQALDMSHNSLQGQFPNWLIKNNTNLELLNLRNNSFGGIIHIPPYMNTNIKRLDMSENHMIGTIPNDLHKFIPYIYHLNLSGNALSGVIPHSIGDLSEIRALDLSDNEFSGEVPKRLFTNLSQLSILKLSRNKLYGEVLSGNLSLGHIARLYLDSNHFTGKIGIKSKLKHEYLTTLDISNNFFTGMIPGWISNMSELFRLELVVRNNSFEGQFPCGRAPFSFLDISHNSFDGPIPSCLNLLNMLHLYMGSNKFTGVIPDSFRTLTSVLSLDLGNNNLSGRIPEFLGELPDLRILILRKNNFRGFVPKKLCQLSKASLIDLSGNFVSGLIPSCLENIKGPIDLDSISWIMGLYSMPSSYEYQSVFLHGWYSLNIISEDFERQDEVEFTTKSLSLAYKGDAFYNMAGLDLSCNKLMGKIPEELGMLTQIHALNLSHNKLTGPIPMNFSNLENIESLDLSSNGLTGKVPPELIKLTFLSVFNVSHNNLSGKLPEMKAQFGTFTKGSYEGNPLLCGLPLEKQCTTNSHVTNDPSIEEDDEKWYNIDMTCFYASSGSICVMLLLGYVALLYINPQWRKRWLDWVEACMFTCYYFLYDLVWRPYVIFCR